MSEFPSKQEFEDRYSGNPVKDFIEMPFTPEPKKPTVRNIIWIDVESGTWGGEVNDLVLVSLDEVVAEDLGETDIYSYLAALDDMTDDERRAFAKRHGKSLTDVIKNGL